MSVVIQSSLPLREAMTKEGRYSVVIGNGPLILGVALAMEYLKCFRLSHWLIDS